MGALRRRCLVSEPYPPDPGREVLLCCGPRLVRSLLLRSIREFPLGGVLVLHIMWSRSKLTVFTPHPTRSFMPLRYLGCGLREAPFATGQDRHPWKLPSLGLVDVSPGASISCRDEGWVKKLPEEAGRLAILWAPCGLLLTTWARGCHRIP